jgi:hypothetical protein
MTRKIHLRANKLTETNRAKSFCASKMISGKCRSNSRDTYRFMASEIVSFLEFRNVPSADRCAHCVDSGLAIRNKLRRDRGFTPVQSINDAFVDREA